MMSRAATVAGGRVEPARSAVTDRSSAQARFLTLAEGELDRLFQLAGLVLGNRGDAEDAVGDALLRGWQAADSLRNPAEFRAWLDRIVVNVCRDRLRRRGVVQFIALEGEHDRPGAADEFRSLAERDEIAGALALLPPDERIVIVLHYWGDLTLEGVGDRLGWPVGTVKSRLHRALERIRALLTSSDERR